MVEETETKKMETEKMKVEEKSEKMETESEIKKLEAKIEEKEVKKKKEPSKKDVAVANAYSMRISPKQSIYVCKIIRGKSPELAVARLQSVLDERRPVPMAGLEVGHKKGKGLAGGRFPKNACKAIMEVVKQAGANAVVNGIENPVITIAKADKASAPYKSHGRKGKRAHIHIEVRDKTKLTRKKK